jgi:hypothetical protein
MMNDTETKPGAFDTSEAVNVTTTLDEAHEAGYLGAKFHDDDLTVAGVTADAPAASAAPAPAAKPAAAEPEAERKTKRGE